MLNVYHQIQKDLTTEKSYYYYSINTKTYQHQTKETRFMLRLTINNDESLYKFQLAAIPKEYADRVVVDYFYIDHFEEDLNKYTKIKTQTYLTEITIQGAIKLIKAEFKDLICSYVNRFITQIESK